MPTETPIVIAPRNKRRIKRFLIVAGLVATGFYVHKLKTEITMLHSASLTYSDTIDTLTRVIDKN